jgi:hypothetical protein
MNFIQTLFVNHLVEFVPRSLNSTLNLQCIFSERKYGQNKQAIDAIGWPTNVVEE